MRQLLREHRTLSAVFTVSYVSFLVYGTVTGAGQTIFYAVFVGGGALLVAQLHPSARFSSAVLWGLVGWGVAHMIGGLVEVGGAVIYERSLAGGELRFDKVVHLFGFGFATMAAYELVRRAVAPQATARAVAVTAALIGLGVGAVNETIEFLITLLPGDSNVGGFSNTGWDLVANALGAVGAAVLAPRRERRMQADATGTRPPTAARPPEPDPSGR